jgi:DNA-binding transcriptional LysR family regulator
LSGSVFLKDIADETYVMVPDTCGLTRATRAIFRSHRLKLREYAGEALGYQVLEEWAKLGVGAAILPRSKISTENQSALSIIEKSGEPLMLSYEAVWIYSENPPPHLQAFAKHLRDIIPTLITGMVEIAE